MGVFQGQWNINDTAKKSNCSESQLARGKPIGCLQKQPRSWTRDYQDLLQLERVSKPGFPDLKSSALSISLRDAVLRCNYYIFAGFSPSPTERRVILWLLGV